MPSSIVTTEGGLLPADLLEAVAAAEVPGQRPEDFGLERSRNFADRVAAAWQTLRGQWKLFQSYLDELGPHEAATSVTREQWVVPLLRVLGYQLSHNRSAYLINQRTFAISHRAGEHEDAPPVHIESVRHSLDLRSPTGRPRLSPHALVQEYLNSTEHLWGVLTNGERLRLLRNTARFTRPAYVEFDLRALFEGEVFAEFVLLYRVLHRSRLPLTSSDAADCLLERYHQQALQAGGRVRERLRDGVEAALTLLANGLLQHPANQALRSKLEAGLLTPLAFYRQLLRLVYRLLFLMVAEDRRLIAAGYAPPHAAASPCEPALALETYYANYSVGRLRRLAASLLTTGDERFVDLWMSLQLAFALFEGDDDARLATLGLAPFDGDLFGPTACPDLSNPYPTPGPRQPLVKLYNRDLLAAVRKLSLYYDNDDHVLRRVNYGALDVEELGSVYESLLDYRPVVQTRPLQGLGLYPSFELVPGTERKTTGSYYTRPELVQELLASALVPVLDARLQAVRAKYQATPQLQAELEAALLSLRVVDPACGSGHFLLAAARRLGRELARLRAGEDQPAPAQFRAAVREVIQRCIFGVDLNPLAVDLCKLALWIESHCAGMPLSFLDHHIRCGNSLVGATHALVAQGIPDEAFKPVAGDLKPVAASFKKRNKQEREAQQRGQLHMNLDADDQPQQPSYTQAFAQLSALPDDSVAAVRAKAARYAELRSGAYSDLVRFQLWTAAFFLPLNDPAATHIPTSAALEDWQQYPSRYNLMLKAAFDVAAEVNFFHWELEFPDLFPANGPRGFDLVLGNPPWERIKLQEQEHFVDVPAIRAAPNKAAREKLIAAWRTGDSAQQARIARFDAAKQRAEAESRFVRASGRFPLTAVGDVNTYALFAEQARALLAPQARAGIIVPTGIATDDTTKAFFGALNAQKQLISFYDFENREKLFAEVDSRFKFSLLTLGQSSAPTRFLFFATKIGHLSDPQRSFQLTPEEIALINPNTRTAPVFRTNQDAELTKKLYRRAPVLINERTGLNPWGVRFMAMFHMSNDSHLFQNQPGAGLLPLYEAKLLHQYTHRWASYQGAGGRAQGSGGGGQDDPVPFQESAPLTPRSHNVGAACPELAEGDRAVRATPPAPASLQTRNLTPAELADPTLSITPRYWVPAADVQERLAGRWTRAWLLGFRDIARSTDERTAIFSLLPRVAVGHKAPLLFLEAKQPALATCLFISTVNSLCFDFVARQKVGGTSLAFFMLKQLPILPPEAFSPADTHYIVARVVELVYTAWDMQPFAADVWAEASEELREALRERWQAQSEEAQKRGAAAASRPLHPRAPASNHPHDSEPFPPFRWDETRRALLRAELDAYIAKLYGLSRDELRYILDPSDLHGPDFPGETFRVLKEKETKLHGEYRTARLVLEAWDAL